MKENSKTDPLISDFLDFLAASPTPFHAVATMVKQFESSGYTRLRETDRWDLKPEGKYLVVRGDSSLIAFSNQGDLELQGVRMVGAHTDSPCLKIKPNPNRKKHGYFQVLAEVYGGVLLNPWFDRDLSIAGRVTVECRDKRLRHLLVDFGAPVAFIPSLAIHLDREANQSRSINAQIHTVPILFRSNDRNPKFHELLNKQIESAYPELKEPRILDYELCLYDTQPPTLVGYHREFVASARLDNLLSCFVGMRALLECDPGQPTLLVCNNHEEVGSQSAVGAKGPFLGDVIRRWAQTDDDPRLVLDRSVMISADNAHGIHPNYSERHDPNHGPLLNHGPVIKINHNQSYATDNETSSIFRRICERADVPCQSFVARNDMGCGSTIGPATAGEIGVRTLDIGAPQFAMHSIRETCGADDIGYLFRALKEFYRTESLEVDAAV